MPRTTIPHDNHQVLGMVQQDKLARQVQLQRMLKTLEREFGARQEHTELLQATNVPDEELLPDEKLEELAPGLVEELKKEDAEKGGVGVKRASSGGGSSGSGVLRQAELKRRRTTTGDVAGVSGNLANPTMRFSEKPRGLGVAE